MRIGGVISTRLFTKAALGYVSICMGDHLSSRPAVLSSSALLMSLIALQLTHVDQNTFQSCF